MQARAGRALRSLSRDRKRWCPITRCCHNPQQVLEDAFIRSLWDSFAGKVVTLGKWPNYCTWAAGWAENPPECLLDNQPRGGAGKFAEWSLCWGQRAGRPSCLFWSWALARRRSGGMSTFLRMYCSVGRDLGIISCIQTCFIQQTFWQLLEEEKG